MLRRWVSREGSPMPQHQADHCCPAVPQSRSAAGSQCGTTTRCSGAMPSARRRGRWPGWNAGGPAVALMPVAALGCGSGAGNTPSSAATVRPSWRRWRSLGRVWLAQTHDSALVLLLLRRPKVSTVLISKALSCDLPALLNPRKKKSSCWEG